MSEFSFVKERGYKAIFLGGNFHANIATVGGSCDCVSCFNVGTFCNLLRLLPDYVIVAGFVLLQRRLPLFRLCVMCHVMPMVWAGCQSNSTRLPELYYIAYSSITICQISYMPVYSTPNIRSSSTNNTRNPVPYQTILPSFRAILYQQLRNFYMPFRFSHL